MYKWLIVSGYTKTAHFFKGNSKTINQKDSEHYCFFIFDEDSKPGRDLKIGPLKPENYRKKVHGLQEMNIEIAERDP